uniref:Uncharacterized protein n=1 Tax=Catagonus wagneri TaxID=51154 RepID=A0A8C3X022_9CETA
MAEPCCTLPSAATLPSKARSLEFLPRNSVTSSVLDIPKHQPASPRSWGDMIPMSLVEGWPLLTGTDVLQHQLVTSSSGMLYASRRFLTVFGGLHVIGLGLLLLRGSCLWDQGLGASLFLGVFISLLCVDPATPALPSWEGPVTPPQGRGKGKPLPAAGIKGNDPQH